MATTFYKVKNWEKYQHYSNRRPPWIKLYLDLLDDYEFTDELAADERYQLIAMFMLAARTGNKIPKNEIWIKSRIGKCSLHLHKLTKWIEIQDASTPLAPTDSEMLAQKEKRRGDLIGILDHLNSVTGKKFKPTDNQLQFIGARMSEGYSVDDCKKVIDTMHEIWKGTKYQQYLQPSTLFSAKKFQGYLNRKPVQRKESTEWKGR